MAKRALGKGLAALIPEGLLGSEGARMLDIPVGDIAPNPYQPRQRLDAEKLQELVASIRQRGIIQPVVVRRKAHGYELVAGERRLVAAKHLGMATVPAILREATDGQMLELSLVENIQRDDLNAMEEAAAYEQLRERFGLTQETLAEALGKDRSSVANTLRLLKLAEEVRQAITDGKLTRGHALALAALPHELEQKVLARKIISRGLSVRQAEAMVRQIARGKSRGYAKRDPHVARMEDELRRRLGTNVRLRGTAHQGRIEITYRGLQELERVIELILGRQPREW